MPDWALGFLLGIFTALFLLTAFDFRPFKKRGMNIRGALSKKLAMGPVIVAVGGGSVMDCSNHPLRRL